MRGLFDFDSLIFILDHEEVEVDQSETRKVEVRNESHCKVTPGLLKVRISSRKINFTQVLGLVVRLGYEFTYLSLGYCSPTSPTEIT